MFDAKYELNNCKGSMLEWFNNHSGNAKGIIIGISGGKDSTVVAKLWADVIGADNVLGVIMPNGEQKDINDSFEVCKEIGIDFRLVDIESIHEAIYNAIRYSSGLGCSKENFALSLHTQTNIPPRIRMTILYSMGQELGYRVTGTGNLSERYIGYCTKWGDTACDYNPIKNYTSDEVIAIGDILELPYGLVHKAPADGLTGKTDEDVFGFSYSILNNYIRNNICDDDKIKAKIDSMHNASLHKL